MPSLRQRIEALEARRHPALLDQAAIRQREAMCQAVSILRAAYPPASGSVDSHDQLKALAGRIQSSTLTEQDLAVMTALASHAYALGMTRVEVALTAADVLDKF